MNARDAKEVLLIVVAAILLTFIGTVGAMAYQPSIKVEIKEVGLLVLGGLLVLLRLPSTLNPFQKKDGEQ